MSAYHTAVPLRARLLAGCSLAVALSAPALGQTAFQATPTVVPGTGAAAFTPGQVIPGGLRDTVTVQTPQVVINWTPTDQGPGGPIAILPQGNELRFTANPVQVNGAYTVLNRVIPIDPSRPIQFDGTVMSELREAGYGGTSGGSIWFYSPGGIIAGPTSRFDVGNLVLSANDIAFGQGLFGNGSGAQSGTIRFAGAPDGRSVVTILPGAEIRASGRYVALVAPRVRQAGRIEVEGSAALVAGEVADITIPIAGGLFDIFVSIGSNVNAGGETTLDHSGVTAIKDVAAPGDPRRVYMVAVPKNDAVTMLVSGAVGYDAASQATASNGAIYLTTAPGIIGDSILSATKGSIKITGGDFTNAVTVASRDITVDTSVAALNVAGNLDLISGSGTIAMTARDARNIGIGGNLFARLVPGRPDGSSSIAVTAEAGSTISTVGLRLESGASGNAESGYGTVAATSATGSSVSLAAAGGIITSSGNITLASDAIGGAGSVLAGGAGTGGSVTASATNGGRIDAQGLLDLSARGDGGGSGNAPGGFGKGGSGTLIATGGGEIEANVVRIAANGFGGFANTDGGSAAGGTATVSAQGGSIRAGGIFEQFQPFQIDASAFGGNGSTAGGNAIGGGIDFTSTAGGVIFGGGALNANGNGGRAFSTVAAGNGTGGAVRLAASGGTIDLSNALAEIKASGEGGSSNGAAPTVTGRGGSISIALTPGGAANPASTVLFASMFLEANGTIEDLSDGSPEPNNGGTGIGGTVKIAVDSGLFSGNGVELTANGFGGIGAHGGSGGAGHQGQARLSVSAGDVTVVGGIAVDALAFGGVGVDEDPEQGAAGPGGSAGVGANPYGAGAGAYVDLTGGNLTTQLLVLTGDSEAGLGGSGDGFATVPGDGRSGGDATGGIARFSSSGAAGLSVDTLVVSAQGLGGSGGRVDYGFGPISVDAFGGDGGRGTGGIASAAINGSGTNTVGFVFVGAIGQGGAGGDIFSSFGRTLVGTGRGGVGGDAEGGNASIRIAATMASGVNLAALGDGLAANGGGGPNGGSGGRADGGAALIEIGGGENRFAQVTALATAIGGSGAFGETGDGGSGGAAFGGDTSVTVTGSGTAVSAGILLLDSNAFGGSGADGAGNDTGGDGGDGGSAVGGRGSLSITEARVDVEGSESSSSVSVEGLGGVAGNGGGGTGPGFSGGLGGNGGGGSGGNAIVLASGGSGSLGFTSLGADGRGGAAGVGGTGPAGPSANGIGGIGGGGGIVVQVGDLGTSLAELDLGFAQLSASGNSDDQAQQNVSGNIAISSTSSNAAGGLAFLTLDAAALGDVLLPEAAAGVSVIVSNAPVRVTTAASFDALGPISFQFSGSGAIEAGGPITITSATDIGLKHSNRGAGASIQASNVLAHSKGALSATPGSLLKSAADIDARAFGGSLDLAGADAGGSVTARASNNVTIGSVKAVDAVIFAGQADADSPYLTGQDARFTGSVQLSGDADVSASRDIIIATGAQIIADKAIRFASGDDIVIGAGALVRAANDPPVEFGYGATEPLQQRSQFRLLAGTLDAGPVGSGEVASILIDGTIESLNRTIQMEAGAIQAGPATQLTAGNLFVRIVDAPGIGEATRDDGGQLTAACVAGNVCLGAVNVSGIVRIGELGFVPNLLSFAGGMSANDIRLRSRDTLALGGDISAVTRLQVESRLGDVVIAPAATLKTTGGPLSVLAGRDIVGGGAIQGNGDVGLSVGRDMLLGALTAGTLRGANDQGVNLLAGPLVGVRNITVTKNLTVIASPVVLTATGFIDIEQAVAGPASAINLTAAGPVRLGAGSGSVNLSGAGATLNSFTGTTATVASGAGLAKIGTITAIGSVQVTGADVTFASIDALSLDILAGTGSVIGGSAKTVQVLNIGSQGGSVTIDQAVATGPSGSVFLQSLAGTKIGTASSQAGLAVRSFQGATFATGALSSAAGDVEISGFGGTKVGGVSGANIAITGGQANPGEAFARADVQITGAALATGTLKIQAGNDIIADGQTLGGKLGATFVAAGSLNASAITSTSGAVSANAAKGITLEDILAGGPVTLTASAGAIKVATDIASPGPIQATGQSVALNAVGDLKLAQAIATAGDIVLQSKTGGISLSQANASNALTAAAAGGTIAIDGAVTGATIALTSKDLTIGATGQLGNAAQTTGLTLTSTADRLFLGDAAGNGYRIDAAELARIATKGDIAIVSAPVGAFGAAFNLLDPAASNVVVGALTFDGAQLGTSGTFRVDSPRSIGIVGNAQFKNFQNAQTVIFDTSGDLALAAETGLVTVKNSTGGLAGTLVLEAQQVHAMSTRTRTEIAGLTLNEVRQRLGTNDQVENDGGYFQANRIIVRIGRLAFIQNSGANGGSSDARRGFSANNLTLIQNSELPIEVVINGRVGAATGEAVIGTTTIEGRLAAGSAVNGCTFGAAVCGAVVDRGPIFDGQPLFSSSRDQIRSEQEADEQEEALQAAQTRPDPIIQLIDAPTSRFDPLIDEPVTGAGNEDLWEPTP